LSVAVRPESLPMKKHILALALTALLPMVSTVVHAAVKPTEDDGPKYPEIWQKAGPQERLKALRAAELDGDRLLAERIFGLSVSSDTTVSDLALENDEINGMVDAVLAGAITTGTPDYKEDGQVQVVRVVNIQEITEKLKRFVKGRILANGKTVTDSDEVHASRSVQDKTIDVMGNAALPGSEGQNKILAKRAAEMDAYRRLAARIMGQKISGDTTVKDMAVENDKIVAGLAHVLKAATPTAITYHKSDGTCDVTMEVKFADVIRTIRIFAKNGSSSTHINDEVKTRVFSETGHGAPRVALDSKTPHIAGSPTSDTPEGSPSSTDVKAVITETIQSQPVLQ
jgi:hypothetical protein